MSEIDPSEIVWRLTFGEEVHEFSRSHWMLSEARDVKKWTGLTPPQMWASIAEDDPEALTALLCVLRRRAGQDVRFSDVEANFGAMRAEPLNLPDEEDEADPPSAA